MLSMAHQVLDALLILDREACPHASQQLSHHAIGFHTANEVHTGIGS